jgi:hypothetical protein
MAASPSGALLTGLTGFREDYLAPQVRFEPTTLWLTSQSMTLCGVQRIRVCIDSFRSVFLVTGIFVQWHSGLYSCGSGVITRRHRTPEFLFWLRRNLVKIADAPR